MNDAELEALLAAARLHEDDDRLMLADAYEEAGYDEDAALLRNLSRRVFNDIGVLVDAGPVLMEEQVEAGLKQIGAALEEYWEADDDGFYCGVSYNSDDRKPWRLSDGMWWEEFATLEEAIASAADYVVSMREDTAWADAQEAGQ